VTRRLFVLLPPSQAKGSGGSRNTKVGTFDATLELARRQVVMALGALVESGRPKVIEKTLQVQGPLLERAIESTRALVEQRALWLPAWRRYTGVVWVHLDPAMLTPTQRRRVLIPSALYGVTTAQDYVSDYRLKMNVGLVPLGGLAKFWRSWLTPVLADYLHDTIVINLLPKEHGAAIDVKALSVVCHVVNVSFVGEDEGALVGHDAKAVKGVLARQLLINGFDAIKTFSWDGWHTQRDDDVAVSPSQPTGTSEFVIVHDAAEA
jgi:cytoplasmic iron level regulating protein YaaA (DUF328/UPF0246 family)